MAVIALFKKSLDLSANVAYNYSLSLSNIQSEPSDLPIIMRSLLNPRQVDFAEVISLSLASLYVTPCIVVKLDTILVRIWNSGLKYFCCRAFHRIEPSLIFVLAWSRYFLSFQSMVFMRSLYSNGDCLSRSDLFSFALASSSASIASPIALLN